MKSSKKQIKISVFFSTANLDEMKLKDGHIVVIDVLRASTTIVTALKHGAKEIMPVNSVENAVKISGNLYGDVTLRAGERNSKMIEGFNLGNSPLEYTEATVKGKSIIFMTTNGTVAIQKGRHAKNLVIGCFVNLSSVVGFLRDLGENFTIVCAGNENEFCIEDAVCAGRIINTLEQELDADFLLDDSAVTSKIMDKSVGKNVLKMLKASDHGKYLAEIGFSDDLKICAGIDTINLLPVLIGNVIKVQTQLNKQAG